MVSHTHPTAPPLVNPPLGQLTAAQWQQLVSGDKTVFRLVYQQHVALIHYVARRVGLGTSDVEDIVQEVFLRLHQKVGEIQGPEKLKAWLATCARNLAIDRRRRSRRFTESPLEAGGEEGEAQGRSEQLPEVSEKMRAAYDDQLAQGHRELELQLVGELLDSVAATPGGETLRLFYRDGLPVKEIAAKNGEAVSTVTTRLSRLRAKFKDEFRRHLETLRERTEAEHGK